MDTTLLSLFTLWHFRNNTGNLYLVFSKNVDSHVWILLHLAVCVVILMINFWSCGHLQRELIVCSHDILAFKRDHVARSALAHSRFILPDGSSESATTSLKGNTEGYRSCSEAVQRSDDVTVDSSVSAKPRVRVTVSMDTDPKVDDDCSTSQSHYHHQIPERMQFSGKQIPHRAPATSHNLSDESGRRSKSRKVSNDSKTLMSSFFLSLFTLDYVVCGW